MINVMLVEDHPLVTEGIRRMLEAEKDITCISSYNNEEVLCHALTMHQPDVILMDINLPDINGIDLCKKIKFKYPAIYIIALSINNHPGIVRQMIDAGASGYLLKDVHHHEIINAIKVVAQGKQFFSNSIVAVLRSPQQSSLPPLTRREKEVLELITDGLTNKQIAEKLFVDVTTIDSHRKNMLAKYNAKNISALIKLAIKEGLLNV